MNRFLFLLITILFSCLNIQTNAQSTIPCSAYCVTNIQLDSLGEMAVDIHFTGTASEFVSYPYVSTVIDINGDTVGQGGSLFYFGQIGGTTQTYPLPSLITDIPSNFQANVVFVNTDTTCVLSYPCVTTGVENQSEFVTELYPNPTSDWLNMKLTANAYPLNYHILTLDGKELLRGNNIASQVPIDVRQLTEGIYIIEIYTSDKGSIKKKFIIQK